MRFACSSIFRFFLISFLLSAVVLHGQTQTEELPPAIPDPQLSITPYFTYNRGFGVVAPDSNFVMNIRFRIQNRLGFTSESGTDFSVSEVEARVRRLRLRFDGFVLNPKLAYVIQLSFTRADMDFDVLKIPNVLRDAMIFYAVTPKLTLGLGQTKLPGNRQRVISSGDQQFIDRSIVNATFNIDRDFGLQAYYQNHIGRFHFVLRAALTSGEGRNALSSDRGIAYTGRLELLPFGRFTNSGDYFEGDLEREPAPKISVAGSYSFNNNAVRTGGQLGGSLFSPADITTIMADFLFKYRGFSLAAEFLQRTSPTPVTKNENDDIAYVYEGYGQSIQASYLFRKNYETALRHSRVAPFGSIEHLTRPMQQYTIVATKYLRGHRVKIQSDLTYEFRGKSFSQKTSDNWQIRFQIELGI